MQFKKNQITTKNTSNNILALRFRQGLVQGTETPQGRKYERHTENYKSPTLGWAPKIKKITEQIQKWPENTPSGSRGSWSTLVVLDLPLAVLDLPLAVLDLPGGSWGAGQVDQEPLEVDQEPLGQV